MSDLFIQRFEGEISQTECLSAVLPVPSKGAGQSELARSQPHVKSVRLGPAVGEGSGHEASDDELLGAGRRETRLSGMILLLALSEHALDQPPRGAPSSPQDSHLDARGEGLDEPLHLQ